MKYEITIKFSNIEESQLDDFESKLKDAMCDVGSNIEINEGVYYEMEDEE